MARGQKASRRAAMALWAFPDRGETELLDIFECVVAAVQSLPGKLLDCEAPHSDR